MGLAEMERRLEEAAAGTAGTETEIAKCIGCDRDLDSRNDPYSVSRLQDGQHGQTCLSCRATYQLEPEAICQMWVLSERLNEFVERYKVPWSAEIAPVSVPWWEYVAPTLLESSHQSSYQTANPQQQQQQDEGHEDRRAERAIAAPKPRHTHARSTRYERLAMPFRWRTLRCMMSSPRTASSAWSRIAITSQFF